MALTGSGTIIEKLFVQIRADGKALDSDLNGMLGKFGAFSTSAVGIAAGVAAGVAAIGAAAFAVGRQFEEANKVIIAGSGATGAALAGLKADFADVFKGIPDSAKVAAGALTNLNTLTGATGDTLQALTIQVLDASRALGEDAAGNADALGKALKAFGIEAEDAGAQTDFLFRLTQKFGGSLGTLTRSTSEYGTVLKNAGFTMAQSADLFARLEASGISVSRVMPGLNAAFRRFAAAGLEPKAALEAVIVAMKNAESETKALTIATDAFGAEGAQRMTTAVRGGIIPALDELGQGLLEAQGAIEDTTKASETFSDKLGIAFNKLSVAFGGVGGGFLDSLNTGLDAVNVALDAMIPSIQAVSGAFGKFIDAAGTGARIGEDLRKAFDEWRGVVDETTQAVEENIAAVEAMGPPFRDSAEAAELASLSYADVVLALDNVGKKTKEAADELKKFADTNSFEEIAQDAAVTAANLDILAKEAGTVALVANSQLAPALNSAAADLQAAGQKALQFGKDLGDIPARMAALEPGRAILAAISEEISRTSEKTLAYKEAQRLLNLEFENTALSLDDLAALQVALNKAQEDGKKTTEEHGDALNQVSTIATDFSKRLSDVVLGVTEMADALKALGEVIIRTIVEGAFKSLILSMTQQDVALKKLTGAWKNFLGLFGGGKGAEKVGDIATGGASGGAGDAAGGLLAGPIGAIAAIGSLISQVIGNFQLARIEGSLNAIELNTRQTTRALTGAPELLAQSAQTLSAAAGAISDAGKGFAIPSATNAFNDPSTFVPTNTTPTTVAPAPGLPLGPPGPEEGEGGAAGPRQGLGVLQVLFDLSGFAQRELGQLEFQTDSLDTLKEQGSRAEGIFTAIRDSLTGLGKIGLGDPIVPALLGQIKETMTGAGELITEVRNTVSGVAKQFRFSREVEQVTRDQQLRRLEDILKEIKELVFRTGQPQQISINEFGQATFRNQLGPEGVLP